VIAICVEEEGWTRFFYGWDLPLEAYLAEMLGRRVQTVDTGGRT
jgi:hypothetical protein